MDAEDQTGSIGDAPLVAAAPEPADTPPAAGASSFRVAIGGTVAIGTAFQASAATAIDIPRGLAVAGFILALLIIGYLVLRPALRAATTVSTLAGTIPVFS